MSKIEGPPDYLMGRVVYPVDRYSLKDLGARKINIGVLGLDNNSFIGRADDLKHVIQDYSFILGTAQSFIKVSWYKAAIPQEDEDSWLENDGKKRLVAWRDSWGDEPPPPFKRIHMMIGDEIWDTPEMQAVESFILWDGN